MSEQVLDRQLKKTEIVSKLWNVVVAVIAAVACVYAFYYTTIDTLKIHSTDIKEIQQNVETLKAEKTNTEVFKGAFEEKFKAVDQRISNIEASQIRMETKQDKILEILSTIKTNTSK